MPMYERVIDDRVRRYSKQIEVTAQCQSHDCSVRGPLRRTNEGYMVVAKCGHWAARQVKIYDHTNHRYITITYDPVIGWHDARRDFLYDFAEYKGSLLVFAMSNDKPSDRSSLKLKPQSLLDKNWIKIQIDACSSNLYLVQAIMLDFATAKIVPKGTKLISRPFPRISAPAAYITIRALETYLDVESETLSIEVNHADSVAVPNEEPAMQESTMQVDYAAAKEILSKAIAEAFNDSDGVVVVEQVGNNEFSVFVRGDFTGDPLGAHVQIECSAHTDKDTHALMQQVQERRELGKQVDAFVEG